MAEVFDWHHDADQNTNAAPDGFPEGMPVGAVNNAAREVMAVVRRFYQALSGELTAVSRDGVTYTLTPAQTVTAMAAGLRLTFRVSQASADNPTLTVGGITANLKRVTAAGLVNLQANELHEDGIYDVVYVAAEGFVVLSAVVVADAGLTLTVADIPSLPASKITSGEFAAERIPQLNADKIGSGTLDRARLPALAADDITTGTLPAARLPALAAVLDTELGSTLWRASTDLGTLLYAPTTGGGISISSDTTVQLAQNYANFNVFEILVRPGVGDAASGQNQHPVTNVIKIPGSAIGDTLTIISGDSANNIRVRKHENNRFTFHGDDNDHLFGILGYRYIS